MSINTDSVEANVREYEERIEAIGAAISLLTELGNGESEACQGLAMVQGWFYDIKRCLVEDPYAEPADDPESAGIFDCEKGASR